MNTPATQKQLTIVDTVRKMEPEFKLALPAHIPSERFTRIAVTAINGNPQLAAGDVDRRSVLSSITKAAQDGLVIDGREAALVIFNGKNGKQAQYMPMVAGALKKMRNSGEIANIGYGLVYKEEWKQGRFEYIKGDTESLKHEPILFDDKGDLIGVYAVVTLKDGSKVREFMDMKQIQKVRNVSRSKDRGPWVDWFEEMCVKSVLRKVAKLCPMSSDIDGVFKDLESDDEPAHDPETGEIRQETAKSGTRAAAKVKAMTEEPAQGNDNVIDAEYTDVAAETVSDEDLPL